MFSEGKRVHTPDHSQSEQASRALAGKIVGNSSNGGSGDGTGAHEAEPGWGALSRGTAPPAKPAIGEGKQSEAAIPAASMSTMRASMSQQPLRISSKLAGSIDHSSLGRPTTALRPTLG